MKMNMPCTFPLFSGAISSRFLQCVVSLADKRPLDSDWSAPRNGDDQTKGLPVGTGTDKNEARVRFSFFLLYSPVKKSNDF